VVRATGLPQLAGAVGKLLPPPRRLAGVASAALLVAVFPGNLKMAVDASRTTSIPFKAAAYARLPLQLPMIRGAWRAGKA
jgi:uncharacterized membrane protein